ncbi:hypothetical protein Back2_17160 [Nocardioides baekrokdamisoli]|uniref:Uncharacterized protein n=1 Tax=Nocardioides baekrokdamisoli TaxID=1804624 RepID=A0A3G9J345_9ACTN|nr:hypothetical protein [Nocardioides baekrokdamisoli]BBH17429.1 hypothetical protein Back2_17160 [Nocardioides baekrokdamisoli]
MSLTSDRDRLVRLSRYVALGAGVLGLVVSVALHSRLLMLITIGVEVTAILGTRVFLVVAGSGHRAEGRRLKADLDK